MAILLVHQYNKAAFLGLLRQLDEVCREYNQIGFFVYDAAYAQNEHIERNDVLRLHTPLRLLHGEIKSELAAYNALFTSAQYDHRWALIIHGIQLNVGWYTTLLPYLVKKQIGLWGGKISASDGATVHHRLWEQDLDTVDNLDKKQLWADDRFWLADLRIVKKLHGFEERYFRGDVAFRDFGWRLRCMGKKVGVIQQLPVAVFPWKAYQLETMLKRYLEVRNQWLFSRLRLSTISAFMMMIGRLCLDGLGRRKLWLAGYRSGFVDGMKLWL